MIFVDENHYHNKRILIADKNQKTHTVYKCEKENQMIFYATKQTMDRFKLKYPNEMSHGKRETCEVLLKSEKGNPLYEWGVKLFYFDRRKCLQVVHAMTKITVFLIDIKSSQIEDCPNMVAMYLFELYKDDAAMQKALDKYFSSSGFAIYDKLTDKSLISTLNRTQLSFADDGYRFYDFIENGILQSFKINRAVAEYIMTAKINGKSEYIVPKEYFRSTILQKFGD